MDMLVGGESSPSEVSDKIKEILYAKAASKVDSVRPAVGASLFGEDEPEKIESETDEVVDEVEVESEEDEEETQTGDENVD